MILLCLAVAQAGVLPAWTVDDFGDHVYLDDQGWENGWSRDRWYGWSGYAFALTDDHVSEDGFQGYGHGTAADDWLLHDGELDDLRAVLDFGNEDDDTFGLVLHHDGRDSFYMVAWSGDSAPPPLYEVKTDSLMLIRVEGGQPEVLQQVPVVLRAQGSRLEVQIDDGRIQVALDGVHLVDITDPAPLPGGRAGLYSYDDGYADMHGDVGYASRLELSWLDGDDDGVADDADDCEDVADPGQLDTDGDGLGDACDDTPGGDTGTPDTAGQDTAGLDTSASDTGPGPGDAGAGGGTVELDPFCGCAGSGAPGGGPAWLVGLVALARRRRR